MTNGKGHEARRCARGVCQPERTQGLHAPVPEGDHTLVELEGPGVFLGAQITKQDGSNDLTFVDLEIDGRNVVNLSFAAAKNWGLTQSNPYGLVLLESNGVSTLTVGWPTPLRFDRKLTLSVTVKESGVDQILANVIRGSA